MVVRDAEQAVAAGWAASRVLVIDEDLGHSASGVDPYPGFRAWFPRSGSTTAVSCWDRDVAAGPRRLDPGSGIVFLPDRLPAYIPDRLPAYIRVEQYERNLQRTDANRSPKKTQVLD